MPLFDYLETHPFGVTDSTPAVTGAPYYWRQDVDALRSTDTALETIDPTNMDLGTRIDIYIGGFLEAWFVATGAADGTDTAGQVASLHTVAKHFVKGL